MKRNKRVKDNGVRKLFLILLSGVLLAESTVMPVCASFEPFEPTVSENRVAKEDGEEFPAEEPEYPELDYIKGRPLTEEERLEQEALVPKLKEMERLDFSFELPKNSPIAFYSQRVGMPASYDPRLSSSVTSAKNQGSTDMCWAFATIGAIEQAAIYSGFADSSVDYSENHLAYFFYNRETDPMGGTEGDYNECLLGDYLSNGGNLMMASFALSSWIGVAKESISPFSGGISPILPEYNYYSDLKMKNTYFIGMNEDESIDVEEVKKAIGSYGAVAVMYGHYSQYYNPDTAAYYNSGTNINHAVTLLGWDDTYKKENFREGRQPQEDGAFIAKNSYGSSWGDEGFFYISYEDKSLYLPIAYEMMEADAYDNNYQYDGSASLNFWTIPNGGQVGNVFTVKENENGYGQNLRAVQISLKSTDVTYSIQAYKNITDAANPESGTPVLEVPVTGTTSMAGIYTIDLGQYIFVGCGETYSIVVTLTANQGSGASIFGEMSGSAGWLSWTANTKQNQSFYRSSTARSWTDASRLPATQNGSTVYRQVAMRLKALTNDTTIVTPDYTYPEQEIQETPEEQPPQTEQVTPVPVPAPAPAPQVNTTPVAISSAAVKKIANKVYTGKAIKPLPVLTYNGTTLKKGTDYTLTYKNNTKTGKATITVKGKGKFKGTKTVNFYIVPKKLSIKTLKALGNKKLKLTWKRNKTASGYQIQLALDKKFTKGVKTVNIKKNTTISKTISKLKKGKRYYVRIRAYKTVSGKKYYGKYSSVKSVKIK
ncbi:MAG: hypothetical protein HDR01_13905 [Lachnospiraceae bacterium]|nr:hypothetical protein [Lachnospiraceae bacterium]